MKGWLRTAVVVVTVVLLQLALFDDLRVSDVAPEVVLGLAVAAGVTGGSSNGALVGFGAGLLFDLFLATPFGLSALVYCIVAYVAGLLANSVSDTNWIAAAPIVAIGTAVGLGLYVLFGEIIGQPHFYTPDFPRIVAIAATGGLFIGGPLTKLMRFAWGTPSSRVAPARPLGLVN